jgi:hypothetical protein
MQLLEFPAILQLGWLEAGRCSGFRRARQRPSGCGTSIPEWSPATWNRRADFAALSNMAVKIILADRTFYIGVLQNSYRKKATQGGEGTK